jgi:dihydroxyacetone kinase-like protein
MLPDTLRQRTIWKSPEYLKVKHTFGTAMKKLINKPENYVDEVLQGMVAAHPDTYAIGGSTGRMFHRPHAMEGKVGIVSGGGFGHIPVFGGYIGDGLLDACAVGNVFASPDMNPMLESIQFANTGKGVLCVVGNYGGDRMNFDMACEMAEMEDIEVVKVIVADDVAAAPPEEAEKRRGVAGFVYVTKIAGAAAAAGYDLAKTQAAAQKAADNIRSIGVALTSCTVPQARKPTFEIADDEIEIGMGIHGEPGVGRSKLSSVDDITDQMIHRLLADKPINSGDRVAILVNGLGATPVEELYLVLRRANARLNEKGAVLADIRVGNYATSMEMAGASITLMHLDDELGSLLKADAACPFWRN